MGILYEPNTFQATSRLEALRGGKERLTTDDVIELWQVFSEAESYIGVSPSLVDFGYWLSGYSDDGLAIPAEVTW